MRLDALGLLANETVARIPCDTPPPPGDLKGPIHDSDLQSQPRFPTATSTKFTVYGLRQPQPPPWLADRCCGWLEFSDIWWAELKVAVEVAVVYGQKRPDLVSCASKNNAIFARSSKSRSDIVENCDSTEKDWTDRSLRVWVDHQQQSQPRSGCTSRLRLKIAVVDGALKMYFYGTSFKCDSHACKSHLNRTTKVVRLRGPQVVHVTSPRVLTCIFMGTLSNAIRIRVSRSWIASWKSFMCGALSIVIAFFYALTSKYEKPLRVGSTKKIPTLPVILCNNEKNIWKKK